MCACSLLASSSAMMTRSPATTADGDYRTTPAVDKLHLPRLTWCAVTIRPPNLAVEKFRPCRLFYDARWRTTTQVILHHACTATLTYSILLSLTPRHRRSILVVTGLRHVHVVNRHARKFSL